MTASVANPRRTRYDELEAASEGTSTTVTADTDNEGSSAA